MRSDDLLGVDLGTLAAIVAMMVATYLRPYPRGLDHGACCRSPRSCGAAWRRCSWL